MRARHTRQGFTLIEVLIVVVIMAVIAGAVIPRFSSSTEDAKDSSVESNLHGMRTQINMYAIHHLGEYPKISEKDLPQLTSATNVEGEIGESGQKYPHGPYIHHQLPENAHDGSNKVTAVAKPGQTPTAAVGTLGGWLYDESTGDIWPNHAGYYQGSPASENVRSASPSR